jgi:SAM-dependent methyltransferase
VSRVDAGEFWDARAREDAYYFVDNRLAYGRPDEERFWVGGAEAVDRLLTAVGAALRPTDVVLDIGCGIGRLTRVLATRAREVVAIDVSGEMLTRARELNAGFENIRWLQGDGRSLTGVLDSSVDACISHVTFQHIPDPRITLGYIGEIGRVLRPGGWAAMQLSTDPGSHRAPRLPERLRRRVGAALGRAPRGQDHPAWLGSSIEVHELRTAAAAAGLTVERLLHPGTLFTAVLVRRSESGA